MRRASRDARALRLTCGDEFVDSLSYFMIRTIFVSVFLSFYILLVGPPLLLYTLLSRDPDPIYDAGIGGVMFFVRLAGVRVRVTGTERIPRVPCLFAANHTSTLDAPAVVGAIPRRIAILLKESLFRFPIVGQAFRLAGFIPVERGHDPRSPASKRPPKRCAPASPF